MKKIILSSRKQRRVLLTIIVFSFLLVTITGFAKNEYSGGVNTELCIECGGCVSLDPEDIIQTADGKIIVKNPISNMANFKDAVIACPAAALWCNF